MAYCPECNAEMGLTATSCKACGFDFPRSATPAEKNDSGFEYSEFAELTLIVGAFCSLIAAIVLTYIAVVSLFVRQYQASLLSLLQAVIACASGVVFLRVRK
jgi:hypothetical protein